MSLHRRTLLKGLGAAAPMAALATERARAADKTIVYWSHNYPSLGKIVSETMAPGFEKQGGLPITYSTFETNQLETKILTGWVGGAGGPDLVSIGDNNLPGYVHRKLIAPVDPTAFGFSTLQELIDAYEPGALTGFMVDGKLYGIPMDSASLSMYYRKDMFKEAGLDPDKPPTTWEEVTEYGKKLIKRDSAGHVIRAGWSWEARSLSSQFYYWGTLLPQKGVDFLNADGTRNGFNNAAGMAAFQFLYDTFNTSQISALGLAPVISPIDDFGAGKTAMMNSGFWLAPSLEAQYPAVNYKDGIYGIARLPQFASGKKATRLNPWVWMVSANSKVIKETWQFVSYMTKSPVNQAIWVSQAQYIQPWKGLSTSPTMQGIPYASVFLEDSKLGVPTPRTPQFNQLATAVARAYDQISANGARPEVVVPDLAKRVDRLLQDT